MRLITATVAGIITVTVLWYFLNPWVGYAGIRFVRGQGWPISTAWLVAAVGAVAGIVNHLRGRRKESHQTDAAELTASELGLAYTPTVERPAAALPCFADWSSGKDGNTGVIDEIPVSVFDMTSYFSSMEGDVYSSKTVVLLPAAGLPEFTARPRQFGDWIDHTFGFSGVTFDPSAAGDDAEVVRRFGRTVWIDLPGRPETWESATAAHQASVTTLRRLFTPALMTALLHYPDWWYEANGEWLACFRGKVVRPAGERPQMMTAAVEIRAALVAAAANPMPIGHPPLPPLPHPTPGQYLSRLLGTLAVAVIGLFGGFFGGGAAAFEWSLWAIVPFLTLAVGGVVGGVLGYLVGVTIGFLPAVKRWTPPPHGTLERQAEKRRRSKWQTGCGCFGWFAGFFVGFLAFVAIEAVSGNYRMGAWKIALFFASPLTGMIVGLLGFGWIGGRIAGRRKCPATTETGEDTRPDQGTSPSGDTRVK